jgi:phosphoglycerate dehydrogenase-like enzyme
MPKPVVLLDPHPRRRRMILSDAQWARLTRMADVIESDGDGPMSDAGIEQALPGISAVIGQTALDEHRLAKAPLLRAVVNVEGNFQPNIDYAACFRRGIEVLSIAPVFALPVAEMALGLALDLARGITAGDRAMRAGAERYGRAGNNDAILLSRETIGLVGFGNLGRALGRLLQGFRPRMIVHDPWLPDSTMRDEGYEPTSLDNLLQNAKVIFLLAGVTSDNPGFIDRAALSTIRDGSIVVLASRAGIVDFAALCDEAQSGRLRIATDVFPQEPVAPDDPVRSSSILLSSHRAGGIPAAFHDIGERTLDDLELILKGLPPVRLQRAQPQTVAMMRSTPGRTYTSDEEESLGSIKELNN